MERNSSVVPDTLTFPPGVTRVDSSLFLLFEAEEGAAEAEGDMVE